MMRLLNFQLWLWWLCFGSVTAFLPEPSRSLLTGRKDFTQRPGFSLALLSWLPDREKKEEEKKSPENPKRSGWDSLKDVVYGTVDGVKEVSQKLREQKDEVSEEKAEAEKPVAPIQRLLFFASDPEKSSSSYSRSNSEALPPGQRVLSEMLSARNKVTEDTADLATESKGERLSPAQRLLAEIPGLGSSMTPEKEESNAEPPSAKTSDKRREISWIQGVQQLAGTATEQFAEAAFGGYTPKSPKEPELEYSEASDVPGNTDGKSPSILFQETIGAALRLGRPTPEISSPEPSAPTPPLPLAKRARTAAGNAASEAAKLAWTAGKEIAVVALEGISSAVTAQLENRKQDADLSEQAALDKEVEEALQLAQTALELADEGMDQEVLEALRVAQTALQSADDDDNKS